MLLITITYDITTCGEHSCLPCVLLEVHTAAALTESQSSCYESSNNNLDKVRLKKLCPRGHVPNFLTQQSCNP